MSYTAWHDDSPQGPLCPLCGDPLRVDEGPHQCGTNRKVSWMATIALQVGELLTLVLLVILAAWLLGRVAP